MTNEEKAMELFPDTPTLECLCKGVREKLVEMAEWKDKNPSDETIMLILNCIGYEEESWLDFVKKELEKRR